jgi:hypothetical protein
MIRPAALDERQVGEGLGEVAEVVAGLVEDGLAHQLHLHLAIQALRRPDQRVLGIVVGRRAGVRRDDIRFRHRTHGERVAPDDQPDAVFHVVTRTFVPGS